MVTEQRKLFYIDGPLAGQLADAPHDTMRIAGDGTATGYETVYSRWTFVIDPLKRLTVDAMVSAENPAHQPNPADLIRAMAEALGIEVTQR